MVKGYNFFSPVFEGITTQMNIKDLTLVPVASGATVSGGGANFICVIDKDGMAGDSYGWYTTEDYIDHDGWNDYDGTGEYWDVPVAEGEGLYIYAADAGIGIQSAGQVKLESYSRDLVKGYNIVGNCSPVDVNIQDFKLEAKAGGTVSAGGANFICVIDKDGMAGDSYGWYTTEDYIDHDGWNDYDGTGEYWDITYKAGEGIYLYSADNDIKLTLKSAIAE